MHAFNTVTQYNLKHRGNHHSHHRKAYEVITSLTKNNDYPLLVENNGLRFAKNGNNQINVISLCCNAAKLPKKSHAEQECCLNYSIVLLNAKW